MSRTPEPSRFVAGQLDALVDLALRRGRRTGALKTLPTRCESIEDHGWVFVVRILEAADRKPRGLDVAPHARETRGGADNPFLNPDPDLRVVDLSDKHAVLLNKFNVVERHLLVVTRQFEDQQSPLTRTDLEALWICLTELGGLGFYNAGRVAGASQPHKHLQLAQLPLAPIGPPLPVEPRLTAALRDGRSKVDELPFVHALAGLDATEPDPRRAAGAAHDTLRRLLETLDLRDPSAPYNLLMTRAWMLLVPRSRESFGTISVNALGFAGSLLVRDEQRLQAVRRAGPMNVLQSVGFRRNGPGLR